LDDNIQHLSELQAISIFGCCLICLTSWV